MLQEQRQWVTDGVSESSKAEDCTGDVDTVAPAGSKQPAPYPPATMTNEKAVELVLVSICYGANHIQDHEVIMKVYSNSASHACHKPRPKAGVGLASLQRQTRSCTACLQVVSQAEYVVIHSVKKVIEEVAKRVNGPTNVTKKRLVSNAELTHNR